MTIAWHIDVSSIVCTLIRNSKLANQIATLLPIVVKKINYSWPYFDSHIIYHNTLSPQFHEGYVVPFTPFY